MEHTEDKKEFTHLHTELGVWFSELLKKEIKDVDQLDSYRFQLEHLENDIRTIKGYLFDTALGILQNKDEQENA